jgi:hypothetical protein
VVSASLTGICPWVVLPSQLQSRVEDDLLGAMHLLFGHVLAVDLVAAVDALQLNVVREGLMVLGVDSKHLAA